MIDPEYHTTEQISRVLANSYTSSYRLRQARFVVCIECAIRNSGLGFSSLRKSAWLMQILASPMNVFLFRLRSRPN